MDAVRRHLVFLTSSARDVEALSRLLRTESLEVHQAATLAEAAELLRGTDAKVLVAETAFADGNWADALRLLAQEHHGAVLVVSAAHADDRLWAETINCGAYDLIPKPFYAPETCRILIGAYSYATRQESRRFAAAS